MANNAIGCVTLTRLIKGIQMDHITIKNEDLKDVARGVVALVSLKIIMSQMMKDKSLDIDVMVDEVMEFLKKQTN